MLATVSMLTVATGCDLMFPPPREGAPQIEVYADRYEFRLGRYPTTRSLAIALEASPETPLAVVLRDCDAVGRLEQVIDLLRTRGHYDLSITLPDDCEQL